jgi:hypothetical protein
MSKEAGLLCGAYYTFYPHLDGIDQALYFLELLNSVDWDLPPVISVWLNPENVSQSHFQEEMFLFLTAIEDTINVKPMIYTRAYFWDENVGDPHWAGDYPLWTAQYVDPIETLENQQRPQPTTLPMGWDDWTFWQFSQQNDLGNSLGIESRHIDLNFFNGTIDDLLAFSSSKQLVLVMGDTGGEINIWNMESGEIIITSQENPDEFSILAFISSGSNLAYISENPQQEVFNIFVRNINTGEAQYIVEKVSEPRSIAFNQDGSRLAIGDITGRISIWETTSFKLTIELKNLSSPVNAIAFSPDGLILASGHEDNLIQLWDLEFGVKLGDPFAAHEGSVQALAFSPGGEILVSADSNGEIITWGFDPNSWVQQACAFAGRNLTQEEWDEFMGGEYQVTCPEFSALEK